MTGSAPGRSASGGLGGGTQGGPPGDWTGGWLVSGEVQVGFTAASVSAPFGTGVAAGQAVQDRLELPFEGG